MSINHPQRPIQNPRETSGRKWTLPLESPLQFGLKLCCRVQSTCCRTRCFQCLLPGTYWIPSRIGARPPAAQGVKALGYCLAVEPQGEAALCTGPRSSEAGVGLPETSCTGDMMAVGPELAATSRAWRMPHQAYMPHYCGRFLKNFNSSERNTVILSRLKTTLHLRTSVIVHKQRIHSCICHHVPQD